MESDTVVPVFTKSMKVDNKMDVIDLYYFPPSPPSRAVLLVARALGVALNLKVVNIMAGDQMQPDYLKMNPMHSVPTMDDNGFILWESRAIMQYLVDQYDREGRLTMKDPKQIAVVNQRLYFDAGTLFSRLYAFFMPVMSGVEEPNNEKKAKVEEAFKIFNLMMENSEWAAGDRLSIADMSLVATVSTAEAVRFDITKYPNVYGWFNRVKKALGPYGYEEINQAGVDMIAAGYKSKVSN